MTDNKFICLKRVSVWNTVISVMGQVLTAKIIRLYLGIINSIIIPWIRSAKFVQMLFNRKYHGYHKMSVLKETLD